MKEVKIKLLEGKKIKFHFIFPTKIRFESVTYEKGFGASRSNFCKSLGRKNHKGKSEQNEKTIKFL